MRTAQEVKINFPPINKKTASGLFVFVFAPGLSTNEMVITFAEPRSGGFTWERNPGLSALLRSLVSPRDLTKSPYRFVARC